MGSTGARRAWDQRPRLDPDLETRLDAGIAELERFSMGESRVQRARDKLANLLHEDGIPYALIGALALNAYGYERATVDVDILLTAEALEDFKRLHLGRSYVQKFPGSRGFRDAELGVNIDVVLAGEYPGDGLPKPIIFPDPATVAVRGERVALLPLPRLVELKLASGMTAPHRLKDLADVLETIRVLKLPEELAADLDPYVRDKFMELWRAAQAPERE